MAGQVTIRVAPLIIAPKREASSTEVAGLRKENSHLKQLVADLLLKNDVLKTT